jgi:hypothetical protein
MQQPQLPYHAELRPYDAARASKIQRTLGYTRVCGMCGEPLGESGYKLCVPPQVIDGIEYGGYAKPCCSQQCALSWLEDVTLWPVRRSTSRTPITDTLPTQETRDPWIFAFRKQGNYPEHTEQCGKWLIYRSARNIDEYWQRIKQAVEQGQLGNQAKVSTAASQRAKRDRQHVICVFTYDKTDSTDARRIRQVLRGLGITEKLPYKSDEDTLKGRYGRDSTSVYYE